jgi:LPS O-antigen subunit length determinant protein (WzzB/FepE family)
LVDLVLRLTKYKLENKELLNYLLFEADDEEAYIKKTEEQVQEMFAEIPKTLHQYLVKKTVRKILRILNKQIKYSGNKETEARLRLFYCHCMKQYINMHYNTYLTNLYELQLKKIRQTIEKLHEDLQYDFEQELRELEG